MTSGSWLDYFGQDVALRDRLQHLDDHLPMFEAIADVKPSRVLEVGIGTGVMSAYIAALGRIDVVGADIEETLLEAARVQWAHVTNLSFTNSDAFSLADSFAQDAFDVAFSQGFFEHFSDEQVRELVEQQLRVAMRVVFSVPSDQYGQQDFGDERLMSAQQWARILASVGHATVRTDYYRMHRDFVIPPRGPFGGVGGARYLHVLAVVDRA